MLGTCFMACAPNSGNEQNETAGPDANETRASGETAVSDYSSGLDDYGYIVGVSAKACLEKDPVLSDITVKRSEVSEQAEATVKTKILDVILSTFPEKITDRSVEAGDQVRIAYTGRIDGVAFQGGTTSEEGTTVTAGTSDYIDDFLTQIIGHMPGETIDVVVTFPDSYPQNPDLQGKEAVFETTILYIEEAAEAFTEAFYIENKDTIITMTGVNFETAEDLRLYYYDYYYDQGVMEAILTGLEKVGEVKTIPDAAVKYLRDVLNSNTMASYGISIEAALGSSGRTAEEITEYLNTETRGEIMIQWVFEDRDYHFSKDEVIEGLGITTVDATLEKYGLGYLARQYMYKQAMEYLRGVVTFTD